MLSQARKNLQKITGVRHFGNFEQFHPIPPRYFLVKYELNVKQFREKVLDADSKEIAIDHRERV